METFRQNQLIDKVDIATRFDYFEQYIQANETLARIRFHDALGRMHQVVLSDWFLEFINNRIIPVFTKLGMDEALIWSIFTMAAPSWESMQPSAVRGIWFNSFYIRVLEEVKRELLRKSEQKQSINGKSTTKAARDFKTAVNRSLFRDKQMDIIGDLSFSWIILPRAYQLLEEQNARTLNGYLKYLCQKAHPAFHRLMIRIIIEYVGNFALKFMNPNQGRQWMLNILFYGYVATFWKTLRQPPKGMEDMQICSIYLQWVRNFLVNAAQNEREKLIIFAQMVSALDRVFIPTGMSGRTQALIDQTDGLMVALRHGNPGLQSAVRSLSASSLIASGSIYDGSRFVMVPTVLAALLQNLKQRYLQEAPAIRQSIRQLLHTLAATFRTIQGEFSYGEPHTHSKLRFAATRSENMVRDFIDYINNIRQEP